MLGNIKPSNAAESKSIFSTFPAIANPHTTQVAKLENDQGKTQIKKSEKPISLQKENESLCDLVLSQLGDDGLILSQFEKQGNESENALQKRKNTNQQINSFNMMRFLFKHHVHAQKEEDAAF